MRLVEMELSKMKEAPYNPRIELTPDMAEYKKLQTSIETFGNVEPIVWNKRTWNVIGGHQRLSVLKGLGEKKAIVSVVDLEEDKEKLLNLALNKAKGDWDLEKLGKIIGELDFEDVELTGFRPDEISVLLESNDGITDENIDLTGFNDDNEFYGMSYIITVKFENAEEAQEWVNEEGIKANCKPGTKSTVVRFDD